ncbi:hypothetical protein CWI38_0100p0020 [Hamiltosporidium tvaerminnensis]|uniref:Uncharacterized protein n=2 Tax=Hamiltosporidium tvaerminnensis TaxID=1176355 RepID=A0A4V2JY95_9MICR|nr:hypothetical protein CWI38_0100p0020 [Hamiltosporidium tvaerminnensis]
MLRNNEPSFYCKFDKKKEKNQEIRKIYSSKYWYIIEILSKIFIFFKFLSLIDCFDIEVIFSDDAENLQLYENPESGFSGNIDNTSNICCRDTIGMPKTKAKDVSIAKNTLNNVYEKDCVSIDSGKGRKERQNANNKRKFDSDMSKSKKTYVTINEKAESTLDHDQYQPLDLSCKKKFKLAEQNEDKNKEWIIISQNSLVFDYSDEFKIRSEYFDAAINPKYSIRNFTKLKIDIQTFEIFLYVLRFGYDIKFLELETEKFKVFLKLFYDLQCYAESDIIRNLYKNMFSGLRNNNGSLDKNICKKKYENILIPNFLYLTFLNALFDTIDVKYDENTKELSFLKRTNQKKLNSFDRKEINEIIIRTTPEILMLLNDDSDNNIVLLKQLISNFKINGIKISHDNIYYSESAYNNNASMYENSIETLFSISQIKYLQIKFLQLERVNISDTDKIKIQKLEKLESLIFYKCAISPGCPFLTKIFFNHKNLVTLKICGFVLSLAFFKNLNSSKIESLDFSYSSFDKSSSRDWVSSIGLNSLRELWLDNSDLGYKVLKFLLISKKLEFLSWKNADLNDYNFGKTCFFPWRDLNKNVSNVNSGCFQLKILLLHNINLPFLLEILKQSFLHSSTQTLALSKCSVNSAVMESLKEFTHLKTLKLCDLTQGLKFSSDRKYLFEYSLISIDISNSEFIQGDITIFLKQFKCLKKLRISNSKHKKEILELIAVDSNFFSLEELDIAKNIFSVYELDRLSQMKNLKCLLITLDNSIYKDFVNQMGKMYFENMNKLVFINTDITKEIFQLIMEQTSLIDLSFVNSKLTNDFFPISILVSLEKLKHIYFINSTISTEIKRKLMCLKFYDITVSFQ